MAQLIKLLDYVSRYESNPFHYPTQYIRLKQENWKRINELWEEENEKEILHAQTEQQIATEKKKFFKWNRFFKQKEPTSDVYEPFKRSLPKSKKQLTQYFLNELFPFQLKWATSTISQVSYTDQKYYYDTTLKHFLQRLPDIYLLMYYPIFTIKKAPIEGEIILISPIGVDIIVLMNDYSDATILAEDDRTWSVEQGGNVTKIISPIIALKRTEQIIKRIFSTHKIDFTIEKTIISQRSSILFTNEPYKTSLIGKREYDKWLEEKRSLRSPLKSTQLKVIEALLHHCQTTSVKRPEWEDEEDEYVTPVSYEDQL